MRRLQKVIAIMLVLLLVIGVVNVAGIRDIQANESTPVTIAEWRSLSGVGGALLGNSIDATHGVQAGDAALLFIADNQMRDMTASGGGPSVTNLNSTPEINFVNNAWWQVTISTTGLSNIGLTWTQRATNFGPRDWALQYSTDGIAWHAATTPGNITLPSGTMTSTNGTLPTGADNQAVLHIRWVLASDISTNGSTIASAGTTQINNIIITGTPVVAGSSVIPISAANAIPSAANVAASELVTVEGFAVGQTMNANGTPNTTTLLIQDGPNIADGIVVSGPNFPAANYIGQWIRVTGHRTEDSGMNRVQPVGAGVDSLAGVTVITPQEARPDFIPVQVTVADLAPPNFRAMEVSLQNVRVIEIPAAGAPPTGGGASNTVLLQGAGGQRIELRLIDGAVLPSNIAVNDYINVTSAHVGWFGGRSAVQLLNATVAPATLAVIPISEANAISSAANVAASELVTVEGFAVGRTMNANGTPNTTTLLIQDGSNAADGIVVSGPNFPAANYIGQWIRVTGHRTADSGMNRVQPIGAGVDSLAGVTAITPQEPRPDFIPVQVTVADLAPPSFRAMEVSLQNVRVLEIPAAGAPPTGGGANNTVLLQGAGGQRIELRLVDGAALPSNIAVNDYINVTSAHVGWFGGRNAVQLLNATVQRVVTPTTPTATPSPVTPPAYDFPYNATNASVSLEATPFDATIRYRLIINGVPGNWQTFSGNASQGNIDLLPHFGIDRSVTIETYSILSNGLFSATATFTYTQAASPSGGVISIAAANAIPSGTHPMTDAPLVTVEGFVTGFAMMGFGQRLTSTIFVQDGPNPTDGIIVFFTNSNFYSPINFERQWVRVTGYRMTHTNNMNMIQTGGGRYVDNAGIEIITPTRPDPSFIPVPVLRHQLVTPPDANTPQNFLAMEISVAEPMQVVYIQPPLSSLPSDVMDNNTVVLAGANGQRVELRLENGEPLPPHIQVGDFITIDRAIVGSGRGLITRDAVNLINAQVTKADVYVLTVIVENALPDYFLVYAPTDSPFELPVDTRINATTTTFVTTAPLSGEIRAVSPPLFEVYGTVQASDYTNQQATLTLTFSPYVYNFAQLQARVAQAEPGTPATITLGASFSAPQSPAQAITIPAGVDITLTSNTSGPHSFTQAGWNVRHFVNYGTLTLQDVTLSGRNVLPLPFVSTANSWGGILVQSGGTLVMHDGATIRDNASPGADSWRGGGVNVQSGAAFIMYGGAITDNGGGTGGGVYVAGTFTMYGGQINNNHGSGIGISAGGAATITGGEIAYNRGHSGGGIYMAGASLVIENASIHNNHASMNGGGLFASNGNITMRDSTVTENNAGSNGGGISLGGSSTFTMENGNIDDNTARISGGGVHLSVGASTFTMNGGTINDNTANADTQDQTTHLGGGGVFVSRNATFNMNAGEISGNNSGRYGGGVHIGSAGYVATGSGGGTFNMNAGTITNNTALRNGGGIYIRQLTTSPSTLNRSNPDVAIVTGNSAGGEGQQIYPEPPIPTITITSPATISRREGQSGTLQLTATVVPSAPAVFTQSGAPQGVTINAQGVLVIPSTVPQGTYTFTITATAGSATANQTFTLTITPPQQTPSVPSEPSTSTETPPREPDATIPANNNTLRVGVLPSDNNTTATLILPPPIVDVLLNTAKDAIDFDFTELRNVTTVVIPRAALSSFANNNAALEFILCYATISLDTDAVRQLGQNSQNTSITVSAAQEIIVRNGSRQITAIEGIVTITVPWIGPLPISVWMQTADGERIRVPAVFCGETDTVSFETSMFGNFMILPVNIIRFVVGQTAYSINDFTHVNDVAPFIDPAHDRVMIPLRAVSEALGARVEWIQETLSVEIFTTAGVTTLYVGVPLPDSMGTPVLLQDRVFVPLRYVAETLGALDIRWDEDNNAAYVYQAR